MHHCLQVPEILQNILDSLYGDVSFWDFGSTTRQARASMARTCKLFYEPSMNSLWFSLTGLQPLVQCLPPDTWEMRQVGAEGMILGPQPVIIRAPSEDEWAGFLTNAARVRVLNFGSFSQEDYLRMMRMHLPTPCRPFPRLRKIILPYVPDTPSLPGYIPMLLNPGLQSFAIGETDPNVVCAVLGNLFDQCPDLRLLSVESWNADSLAFISRFKKLQQLMKLDLRQPSPVSTAVVSFLATSPFLRELFIRAPYSLTALPRMQDVPTFPNLVYLDIDAIKDVLVVTALLRLVPGHSLSTLILSFEDTSELSNAGHMKTLLNTISTFRSLKELKIMYSSHTEGSLPPWDIDPLLQLTSLEYLAIQVSGCSFTRDLFRRGLDTPWPRLKALSLHDPYTLPPLDILGDCAHYLPSLEHLAIPVDAITDPASPVPLGQSTRPVQLCVDGSSIIAESCPSVAAYIALAYPNASLVYDDDYDGDDVEDERFDFARCWNKVIRMFPVMASVVEAQTSLMRDGKVDARPGSFVGRHSDEN